MSGGSTILMLVYLLIALFCLALMIAPTIIIPLVILAHQKKEKKARFC